MLTTSYTDLQFDSSAGRKTVSISSILDRIVLEHRKCEEINLNMENHNNSNANKYITNFIAPSTEVSSFLCIYVYVGICKCIVTYISSLYVSAHLYVYENMFYYLYKFMYMRRYM